MGKPLVGGRAVPVVDIRRNFHHIAGQEFPCLFSAFLIEADSSDRDQQVCRCQLLRQEGSNVTLETGTWSRSSFVNGAR